MKHALGRIKSHSIKEKIDEMNVNPKLILEEDDVYRHFPLKRGELSKLRERCRKAKSLEFPALIRYIIILYSDDSPLNRKPIRPLQERQVTAARMARLKEGPKGGYSRFTEAFVFRLEWEELGNVVMDYLIWQNNYIWSEIATLEQQMEENQRLRMAPVTGKTSKDSMMAFDKKHNMTKQFKEWHELYKMYLREFYGDHEEVKSHMQLAGSYGIEARAR